MPEAPDLEAIRGYLNRTVAGRAIVCAEVRVPIVARFSKEEFSTALSGNRIDVVDRRGKFLLFRFTAGNVLAVNPMLTGRFQYVEPQERQKPKTCAVVNFDSGKQLRYVDAQLMGKLYLADPGGLDAIPQYGDMGPDVLDPALSEEVFRRRLRRHPGQVKNILTNHAFVAGIGNAYADEILFVAGIHPYRKRTRLSDEEIGRLYHAIGAVMCWAIPILAEKMRDGLVYDEWRGHLRVHNRGGEPCPVCGARISQITAGQQITSFCRRCQGSQ
jgi:formamidopyrimidine-DNA glycosylase